MKRSPWKNNSQDTLNHDDIEKAREISKLLYRSKVYKTYENDSSNPVTLRGYLKIISAKISKNYEEIIGYFELAHRLKFITIYKDESRGLCLKKGEKYMEIGV